MAAVMVYWVVLAKLLFCELSFLFKGGSVAVWFRALNLKSRSLWFKSSTLLLSGFVLGSPEFNSLTVLCLQMATWLASDHLGFLIVYVLFAILSYLFTLFPVSTTVLNTLNTQIKLLLL